LFRTSFLQSRLFPTEYHHYGKTAWTFQNLPEMILAYYPNPVARFTVHDHSTKKTVMKKQIYSLTENLRSLLPPDQSVILMGYVQSSQQIDKIRDPHPKFGWWWMPDAWAAKWKRNNAQRFSI
jgi:hypothetical protein